MLLKLMRGPLRLAVVLSALSGFSPCVPAADASSAAPAQVPSLSGVPAPSAVVQGHGLLYKVSGHGRQAYLFGTIHVGADSFYPLGPAVDHALGASSELVLELDTRADLAYARAVLAHGSYGPGQQLQDVIAPATLERLTQALHALGITVSSMAHVKPWLIANILMGLELQRNGFDRA